MPASFVKTGTPCRSGGQFASAQLRHRELHRRRGDGLLGVDEQDLARTGVVSALHHREDRRRRRGERLERIAVDGVERDGSRRLLLHRRQINKLIGATQRQGYTVVPLKIYFNERGRAKVELGLGKGKQLHDKRETAKQRDWDRDRARLLRDRG